MNTGAHQFNVIMDAEPRVTAPGRESVFDPSKVVGVSRETQTPSRGLLTEVVPQEGSLQIVES